LVLDNRGTDYGNRSLLLLMSNYFDHEYLSHSDLKSFEKKVGLLREDPPNLQAIFDLGTLIHSTILEPHLVEHPDGDPDYELAKKMRKTFFEDGLCRAIVMGNDFVREKEFYNPKMELGVKSRCKMDGARTNQKFCLELKGLNVMTENQFNDALVNFNYDRGIAWYLLTAEYRWAVIVGISKKDPTRLFKRVVKRGDEFYLAGEQKCIDVLKLLKNYSPEDFNDIGGFTNVHN